MSGHMEPGKMSSGILHKLQLTVLAPPQAFELAVRIRNLEYLMNTPTDRWHMHDWGILWKNS